VTAWRSVRLADICDVTIGRTPARERREYWNGHHPWAAISDLNQGRIITSTAEGITERAIRDCNCRLVPAGTVLLSFKLSIGKVAISGIPLFTNEAIAALPIRDRAKVDAGYLSWALRSLDLTAGLDRAAKGLTLNKAKLVDLDVPLPPLVEQRRIAAILDQADALRAKRRAALAQLDEMARAIFVEMFGASIDGFRRWPMRPLADLVADGDNINYGVIQPGDEFDDGVPLVRVGDLVGGSVHHAELKRIDPEIEAAYRRSRLVGDEILVSCVGSIGVVALATSREIGFNIARAVARVRVGHSVRREFVAAFLQTDHVQEYFRRELRTVSQPTLNIKQLGETIVPIPPKELQAEFIRRLEGAQAATNRMQQSEMELDALFSSLQHRAFRGEL
jgi:type I restriction enzyme S subunit